MKKRKTEAGARAGLIIAIVGDDEIPAVRRMIQCVYYGAKRLALLKK